MLSFGNLGILHPLERFLGLNLKCPELNLSRHITLTKRKQTDKYVGLTPTSHLNELPKFLDTKCTHWRHWNIFCVLFVYPLDLCSLLRVRDEVVCFTTGENLDRFRWELCDVIIAYLTYL
jgi:hypothetical protein